MTARGTQVSLARRTHLALLVVGIPVTYAGFELAGVSDPKILYLLLLLLSARILLPNIGVLTVQATHRAFFAYLRHSLGGDGCCAI